jgi:hypothetical protein
MIKLTMIISVATNIVQSVQAHLSIKIAKVVSQVQSFTMILSNIMLWLMAVAGNSVQFQHSNLSLRQVQERAKIAPPTASVMECQLAVLAA